MPDRTTIRYSRNGVCKPFLYAKDTQIHPFPLIFNLKQLFIRDSSATGRNSYWIAVATIVAGLSAGLFAYAFPVVAGAFWPFTDAKAAITPDPIIHDSTLALLTPATNPDPNPDKGASDLAITGGSALLPDDLGTDGASAGGAGAITLYQVRNGDSLSGIADMFNVSVNTILWANDIKDKTIHPGDTLVILPVTGVRYTVKSGGTLADIAKKYDADPEELAIFNGIDVNANLAAGTEIIVPGGEAQSSSSSTTKKPSSGTSVKLGVGTSVVTSGYFKNPLPGGILTQGIHGTNAVDIGAPSGTPIYAAAAGTVIVSKGNGAWNGGYGSYVVITHDNGTQTLYAHMSKDIATVGESITAGDLIGYVGRTGEATGNHLHFEVRGGKNPFGGCALMKACTLK